MGFIPEFKERGVSQAASTIDINQPVRTANAVAGVANSVANAVVTVDQVNQKKQMAEDNNNLALQRTELRRFDDEARKKFEVEFKDNPNDPELLRKYKEDREKHFGEILETFKTKEGKQAASQLKEQVFYQREQNMMKWQTQQTVKNITAKSQKALDNLNLEAAERPSLDNALEAFSDLKLLKNGNISGLGENNANALNEKAMESVAQTYVESALVNKNISEVKRMIKNDEFKKALGSKGFLRAKKQIKAFEDSLIAKEKKLKALKFKNSWAFLDKKGETQGLELLNFSDPKSFISREAFIGKMSDKYEGLDLSKTPIHPAEIEGLKNFVQTKNDIDLNNFIRNIDETLDQKQISRFSKQLFPKAPAIGAAIQMSAQDPEASLMILKGAKRIMSKSIEINNSSIDHAIDQELLNVIDDNEKRSLMKESIKAHLVETVYQGGGDLKEKFEDSELVTKSVEAVIGPKVVLDDSNSVAGGLRSFRGVDGDYLSSSKINDLFDSLTVESMAKNLTKRPFIDGGEKALDFNKFGDRVVFQTVGDGRYSAIDKETGLYLEDQDGESFVLDLKEFYENTFVEDEKGNFELPEKLLGAKF